VEPVGYAELLEQVTRDWAPAAPAVGAGGDVMRGEPMNHRCARTWVLTRRTAVLAALTLLAVGCGATGSPVDTTAAPTTKTTITITATTTVSPPPST
jgi:hypothetical protein